MFSILQLTVIYLYLLVGTKCQRSLSRVSPKYNHAFQYPMPVPKLAQPLTSYIDPTTGIPIDYFELDVRPFQHRFFPDLSDTQMIGFNGTFPGPTFQIERGRQSVVRVINHGHDDMVMHLHGSYTRSPWDGWALDSISPGQEKFYYYPNAVNARTLWYHDHIDKHNAVNVYKGLAGLYQIVDRQVDTRLGLPTGNYDVPLILTAAFFTHDGILSDIAHERTSTYGDTFLVNGQIQPYLSVEPRNYRFRILNAAVSRVFNLGLHDQDSRPLSFTVIGSDGGLRPNPVNTASMVVGMADRWEVRT